MSAVTTILATLFIVTRILMVGRLPGTSSYRSVIEIIVESAALYSIALLVYIPFYADKGMITGARRYYLKSLVIPISVSVGDYHHLKYSMTLVGYGSDIDCGARGSWPISTE
jgi:hydrogenase-4 membrane subunit HyfE